MSSPQFQTIHLASDHAGFGHKESVRIWLLGEGFAVVDHGAFRYDAEDDFPEFIIAAGKAIQVGGASHAGIIFGGSGQGEALAINRLKGIRAGVFYGGNNEIVPLTRLHNDANVLSVGARFVSVDETKEMVWRWIHTDFLKEEKYSRRNQQIDKMV
ncbi:MAG: RpiB/LacA/LacB family sugar-phosphate isomerase [Candidatus Paceibacteria bacterium]